MITHQSSAAPKPLRRSRKINLREKSSPTTRHLYNAGMRQGEIVSQQGNATLVVAVSELTVLRALELAGNRLLGKRGRSVRGPMKSVATWAIHTRLRVEGHEIDVLLKDAWKVPIAVGLPDELIDALDRHTRTLLAAGIEFRRDDLMLSLSRLPLQPSLPWETLNLPENCNVF